MTSNLSVTWLKEQLAKTKTDKTMITYILQMNSDLMHPPSVGSAEHNAARSIEAQSLKLGPALFPSP